MLTQFLVFSIKFPSQYGYVIYLLVLGSSWLQLASLPSQYGFYISALRYAVKELASAATFSPDNAHKLLF